MEKLIELAATVKDYREKLLADPYRPMYHFAIPEGMGMPGDPNGGFYANGRYHLMYLYNHMQRGFCWGHISSADLVHWRHHPDCITPGENARGCFSGGAFVDDDGTAYISFWDFISDESSDGGIRIAKSSDPMYENWEIMPEFAIKCEGYGTAMADGEPISCADPSNIWKKDGKYYMQAGNLLALERYGRQEDSPAKYRGDWVDLFESDDLKSWKFLHRFYERDASNKWTDESEDDMCPSFLPLPLSKQGGKLSDKYLQLFIAHNKGCQYYIGDYDKSRDIFTPETHGRMTWTDNTYFAPEAILDPSNRHIMWAWLLDNPPAEDERGWSGVYGMPRLLWLDAATNTLRMAPADEMRTLRYNDNNIGRVTLDEAGYSLRGTNGESCEITLTAENVSGKIGARLRVSPDGDEYAEVYYDPTAKQLAMDTTKCGSIGRPAVESAPFELSPNETLTLNIFIDKSVIEVYANERQAICRRAYPTQLGCGISIFAENSTIANITAWDMDAANPY